MHGLKRHQLNSIHVRLLLVIVSCFCAFFALFTFSTIKTAQTVWYKLLDQEKSWLVLQGGILDTFFSDANQYLISLSAEVNDMTLDSRQADDDIVALLYGKLVRILKGYNFLGSIMDGNFIYLDEPREFIAVSSARTDYKQRQSVREILTAYMEENRYGSRNWIAMKADDGYFLCKILQVDGGRLGIWLSVETMLHMLNESKTSLIEYVNIVTDGGLILDQNSVFYHVTGESLAENRMVRLGDGARYMPLKYDFSWGDFQMLGWMNERKVMTAFSGQLVFFALLTVLLLCLLSVTIFLMKRWFLTPLSGMIAAMNEIRRGRLDRRLDLRNAGEEFLLLQTTFNNMMDDITKAGAAMEYPMGIKGTERVLRVNTVVNGRQAILEPNVSERAAQASGDLIFNYPGAEKEAEVWLNALEGKGELVVKPRQAYTVTRILEAIYESARTGKTVFFEN